MKTGIEHPVPCNIKMLDDELDVPYYASEQAACFDLQLAEDVTILAGQTKKVPLGFQVEIPDGFEMQIRPRSGTSLKTELVIKNSPGTIDADYRGEVCVILKNNGAVPITLPKKGRVCQGAIKPVYRAKFKKVDELSDTDRSEGGFGSTGDITTEGSEPQAESVVIPVESAVVTVNEAEVNPGSNEDVNPTEIPL